MQLGNSISRILFRHVVFRCTPFWLGALFLLDVQVPLKILVKLVRFKVRVDGGAELGLDEAGCAAPREVQRVVRVDSDGDQIGFL